MAKGWLVVRAWPFPEQSRASLHPTPPSFGSICRADAVPLSPAARRCDGTGRDSCHTCTSTAGGTTPLDGRGAEGLFWGRKTHAVCPAALRLCGSAALRLARGPKFLFLFLFLFPLPLAFTHAWRANRAFKARRALNSAMPSSGTTRNKCREHRSSCGTSGRGYWRSASDAVMCAFLFPCHPSS